MHILGVRLDVLGKQDALQKVTNFLLDGKQHTIFTPNPEMIVDAQDDIYFREVLNSGDLNICDGKGIQMISKEKIERIPGIDFMLEICRLAEQKMYSVYFLGSASREVLDNLVAQVKKQFPGLLIIGAHPGPHITSRIQHDRIILTLVQDEHNDMLSEIVMSAPDILFVAFGHGKQEKWIYEHLKDLPSVKVAMGVGGAFDYISGKTRRAPQFIQNAGLEWLYRLVEEPHRFKRIWKATVRFLWLYFFSKKVH